MIQRHWRGIEARSRVSAQLEMELLALQAEDDDHLSYCGGPPDDDSTDETADETLVDGATAERTESDALFAQLEAEAEAEIAAVRASRMHFSPHTHSFQLYKSGCALWRTHAQSLSHPPISPYNTESSLWSQELLQEQAGPEGDGADDGTCTVAYQRDVTIYHSVQF